MTSHVGKNFTKYFENWMIELEELVKEVVIVPRETSYVNDQESLVNKMRAHNKEYYTAKWAAAHEDILAFFTPMWLSSLEIVYLWVTGWKPSMAFRLVRGAADLSDEQLKKIDVLRLQIRGDEEKVEREMERQQVSIGDRKMVELARVNNSDNNELVEMALKGLRLSLERIMKMADCVRLKTLKGLLEILTLTQSLDFFAAISTIQIQMRKSGRKIMKVAKFN